MGAAAHLFQQFLRLVELPELAVDFWQLKVDLLVGVLFEQGQKPVQVGGEVLVVLDKQFFALKNHLAVAMPHAETHETVEEVFQAHMLVVAVQVVVGPPKETAQINLFPWVVVAFLQKGLVVVDEGQLAFVVGETDAEETPCVPRIHLSFGPVVSDERFNRVFHPEDMAARGT